MERTFTATQFWNKEVVPLLEQARQDEKDAIVLNFDVETLDAATLSWFAEFSDLMVENGYMDALIEGLSEAKFTLKV